MSRRGRALAEAAAAARGDILVRVRAGRWSLRFAGVSLLQYLPGGGGPPVVIRPQPVGVARREVMLRGLVDQGGDVGFEAVGSWSGISDEDAAELLRGTGVGSARVVRRVPLTRG